VTSPFYGPKIFYCDGDPNGEWEPDGVALPEGGDHALERIPGDCDKLAVAVSAAGMWLTEDGGRTWRRGNQGLEPRYLPAEARRRRELDRHQPRRALV
jgi:hypothetical protein